MFSPSEFIFPNIHYKVAISCCTSDLHPPIKDNKSCRHSPLDSLELENVPKNDAKVRVIICLVSAHSVIQCPVWCMQTEADEGKNPSSADSPLKCLEATRMLIICATFAPPTVVSKVRDGLFCIHDMRDSEPWMERSRYRFDKHENDIWHLTVTLWRWWATSSFY